MSTFITVAIAGVDRTILTLEPCWDEDHVYEHEWKTAIVESLSLRESRRPEWLEMRTSVSVPYNASKENIAALREMEAALPAHRVGLPLWADWRTYSTMAASYYLPSYWLAPDLGTVYAAGSVPVLPSNTMLVPLLFCRLDPTEIVPRGEHRGVVLLEAHEHAPWNLKVGIRAAAGVDQSTFPDDLRPETFTPVSTTDNVEVEEVGHGREPILTGTLGVRKIGQRANYNLGEADLRRVMYHWYASRGRWKSFDLAMYYNPAESPTQANPDAVRARYSSDRLRLAWANPRRARLSLEWWEVPWELSVPSGEQPEQAARVTLFEFEYRVPVGGPLYYRYNDGEQDVTFAGNVFAAAAIEAGKQTWTRAWDAGNRVTLRAGVVESSPLYRLVKLRQEAPLWCRMWHCDPSDPDGTARQALEEPVRAVGFDGERLLSVEVGGDPELVVPRNVVSTRDNRNLYLDIIQGREATYVREGVVTSIAGQSIYIDWVDGKGNPTADYFRAGIIYAGSGETYEARMVGYNAPDAGASDFVVVVNRPFYELVAGQSLVHLYPGYSGSWADAKTGAYSALSTGFRGYPHIPQHDPTTVSRDPTAAPEQLGKK